MIKVLVTGASGFVGKNFLKVCGDYEVLVVSNNPKDDEELSFNELDRIDSLDYIFHFSALTDRAECERNPLKVLDVNVRETIGLLELGKKLKIKKFIFTSTGDVYERKFSALIEEDKIVAYDHHEITKIIAEEFVKLYEEYFDYSILRLFHPYGPGQESNRLISRLIDNVKNGNEITIFNDGNPIISPIYIGDLVEILLRICFMEGSQILNVAGNEAVSVWELCNRIGVLVGNNPKFKYVKDPNKNNVFADISKLRKVYVPKVGLDEGLGRVLEYGI